MRKLLTMFTALAICGTSTSSVIACDENNNIRKMDLSKVDVTELQANNRFNKIIFQNKDGVKWNDLTADMWANFCRSQGYLEANTPRPIMDVTMNVYRDKAEKNKYDSYNDMQKAFYKDSAGAIFYVDFVAVSSSSYLSGKMSNNIEMKGSEIADLASVTTFGTTSLDITSTSTIKEVTDKLINDFAAEKKESINYASNADPSGTNINIRPEDKGKFTDLAAQLYKINNDKTKEVITSDATLRNLNKGDQVAIEFKAAFNNALVSGTTPQFILTVNK